MPLSSLSFYTLFQLETSSDKSVKMKPLTKLTVTPSFNPADHTESVLQGFTDFIKTWEMWYEVASIGELKADATEVERKEHKAKVFRMCDFSGERLKVDLKAEFN